jgi:hypothetical protein
MYLRDFLLSEGYMSYREQEKIRCPFHHDDNPSAMMHPNHLYCFTCQRKYTYVDVGRFFHIWLDYDAPKIDDSTDFSKVYFGDKGEFSLPKNTVLFEYPIVVKQLPENRIAKICGVKSGLEG